MGKRKNSGAEWPRVMLACAFVMVLAVRALPATQRQSVNQSDRVAVVRGPAAPQLEVYAAGELCGYLKKLFGIDVQPATSVPDAAATAFLIGSPATNPAVKQATLRNPFPQVDDQGIVLRGVPFRHGTAVLVGGGSPSATLWAVYELARHWGVQYLLHGDVLPPPTAFRIPDLNLVLEPKLRVRQWRMVNEFPMGPASWGMADSTVAIDQLAKLKFNRLLLVLWPFAPYLDYEVDGIHRSSAAIFFGYHFPITPDMVGRQLYGNVDEFWNPDLPLHASYRQFETAGEKLIHRLIAYGHERGMQSTLGITPSQFPLEFSPLLKDGTKVHILGETVIAPGTASAVEDPGLTKLASTVIQTTVNTYPEADGLDLGMPEWRQWTGVYEDAWQELNKRYGIEKVDPLASVMQAAQSRTTYPGGAKRAVDEVKGDIVALYFYDRLFDDLHVLRPTRRPHITVTMDGVAEELFPILGAALPPGAEALNFIDYTPARVVKRQDALKEVPDRKVPSLLIYTLNDDNIGPVPQLTTDSLAILTRDLVRYGWAGFSTRFWNIGDQDSNVAYLSRAAWDVDIPPETVAREQLRAACGEACVEPMLSAFRAVENVTKNLEWNALSFSFPVPGMMMKYWSTKPLPAALGECRAGYRSALDDVRRAKQGAAGGAAADHYLDYWEGRLEFATGYFDTVDQVHRAAAAAASGNSAEALRDAQKSLDSARTALGAYALVARDQSDRGAIAMLNEYVYRALAAKIAALKNEGAK